MSIPQSDSETVVGALALLCIAASFGIVVYVLASVVLYPAPPCAGEALAQGYCTLPVHEVTP